ncbi:diguanylate cyclase [Geobacter sp. DSM 9736]|uniref:diguanylate cyclase n=1 Tax=Geobacter sp. DSM 9736 TaxID=1277350 RepID=UPI000B50DA8B|nr:diguanylate cyclase [Geobacter sp. DSM 9736]SNB47668.1 response regulator receiver modulated diguanylate cyclase [Geobacter sp. DSM 9736]
MFDSILIIDDTDAVREQIEQTLSNVSLFARYHHATDGIEGFKTLLRVPVDLILCDLEMPRMDGFKFLSMLRTRDELRDIPVIMLTGREDRELKIRGLEQGASDYVTKPFDPGELVARVKVQMKIKSLQDELKKSNELLKELSNTDPLTRLYNRRYLMEALEREFQRSSRKQGPLSLVLLDIDHFKKINDTYGHQEGDVVLAAVAEMAQAGLRRYDIAARYGGEEFILLLPETPLQEAIAVADRLRESIQEMEFPPPLENLTVTISLGVSTYPSQRIDCIDSLIRQADEALYRAKQNGRNRMEIMAA